MFASTLQLYWQPQTLSPVHDLRAEVLRTLLQQLDSTLPMLAALPPSAVDLTVI